MGVKLKIEFDSNVIYSGQMFSGRVFIVVDRPQTFKAIEVVFCGKTKSTILPYNQVQIHFEKRITIANAAISGENTCTLPIGIHEYPFFVKLPSSVPPSYQSSYGTTYLYAKAILKVPWSLNKTVKEILFVKNQINLNSFPELHVPFYRIVKSSPSLFWCCASGSLMFSVLVPRTAYVYNESIPLVIHVDNAKSGVDVDFVLIRLKQIINWKDAHGAQLKETHTKKCCELIGVKQNRSKTWTKNFPLGPDRYENSGMWTFIEIQYELAVKLDLSGLHIGPKLKIPITIGTIMYGAEDTRTFQIRQRLQNRDL